MSARRLEQAITQWLAKAITDKGIEILDGQVTAEKFNEARAYRRALKDVLGELPNIAKKVDDT